MKGNRKISASRVDGLGETFSYDNLGRLTQVARNSSAYQNFTMSNTGAITAIKTSGNTVSRTTNDENQVTNIGGNGVSYDDNGNVTVDDAGHNLVWDAWNRLVAVEDGSNNLIVGYVYDGLGRMTTFTNGTTSTDLYYSGSQMLEQRVGVTDNTGAYVARRWQ